MSQTNHATPVYRKIEHEICEVSRKRYPLPLQYITATHLQGRYQSANNCFSREQRLPRISTIISTTITMKVAAILFVVACVAVALSVALPIEPDVTSEVRHAHLAPVEEAVARESGAADQEALTRERRRALPQPDGEDKGSVGVDVQRQKGVGTIVTVDADRNLWQSQDGKTRLDAQAQWSRVFNGPAAGKPNYGGFINFSHDF